MIFDELTEVHVPIDGVANERSNDRVRLAKRHPVLDQMLGKISRRNEGRVRSRLHDLRIEGKRTNHPGDSSDRQSNSVK